MNLWQFIDAHPVWTLCFLIGLWMIAEDAIEAIGQRKNQ